MAVATVIAATAPELAVVVFNLQPHPPLFGGRSRCNMSGFVIRGVIHTVTIVRRGGCDASVLLSSTHGVGGNNMAERDAPPNRSLRGFVSVQRVKSRLEAACPSTVSCADILALMARDAVLLASGPYWPVPLGRRDGRVSCAAEVMSPSNIV
uniref:Peroxidase 1-like protein n=1 Tax=Oryza sativa subsp. japonica TaxID=39947 RepID=Q8LGZ5_ORYSJ|nr:peroxidase 1 precursor-like protein [Oryza sativa Japonica Group]